MDMTITDYRDVPHDIRSTAGSWYDGRNSAMFGFWMGKPINAEKLLKEARRDIAECSDGNDKWLPRLMALEAFAHGHVAKVRAVRKLKAAINECAMVGAEMYRIDEWRRDAERKARETRERQDTEAAERMEAEPESSTVKPF